MTDPRTPTQRRLDRLRRLVRWANERGYIVDDGGERMDPAMEISWAIARIERLERIAMFSQGALGDIEAVMDAASNAKLTFDRLERQLKGVWEE